MRAQLTAPPSWPRLAAWFLTCAGAQLALIGLPTWERASRFCFSNFDLGIYSQALAHLSWSTPNPWLSGRQLFLFNDHLDPILALAAPWTRLLPAPRVGQLVESACAVLALAPLAWLARAGRLSSSGLWTLGVLQALHVGVVRAVAFPFHPTTWAVLPMAALAAALALRRFGLALAALALLLACKEEFPFAGLAVGLGLLWQGERRWGLALAGLSLAWAGLAFGLRPWLLGPVHPYASLVLRAPTLDAAAVLLPGTLAVPFVPLVGWLAWRARAGEGPPEGAWVVALPLLPLLALRFLTQAWGAQYGAVVTSAAVGATAAALGGRALPRWLVGLTAALTLAGDEGALGLLWRDGLGSPATQSPGCPALPGRVEAVRAAVERARALPGPLLVGGNLLPWLAERGDVYAVEGPAPAGLRPRAVLLEQPPRGDVWAVPPARSQEVLEGARRTHRVLVDDAFVFLAVEP